MLRFITDPGGASQRMRERYGDMFTVKMPLSGLTVALADPALVRQVFGGDPDVLHAGEDNGTVLEPILGRRSVLVLDGSEHMRERKLMLPPFHGERMRAWGDAMRDLAREAVARWRPGQELNLLAEFRNLTLEIILRVVFGLDEVAQQAEFRRLLQAILDFSDQPLAVLPWFRHELGGLTPWGRFVRLRRLTDEAIYREIAKRRREGVEGRTDVFSLLLEARRDDGSPMTDIELRDELMTLLIAGHETTATALAWSFDLLLHNPEPLEKLLEEVEGPYLDAVIKEAMRIRPVIGLVGRLLKEDWELGGYHLPAGVSVAPHIWLIHHREDLYPEPEAFRPERFLGPQPDSASYLPFGGGVRRCLGASFATYEMRMVIPEVLRSVRLRARWTEPDKVRREAVTLVPARGAQAIVEEKLTSSRNVQEHQAAEGRRHAGVR